ncbi:MAG: DMT family transporter [Magnetospirillum sp.]|nr:DMT family transporter [Magnetospirillum sp.]
MLMGGSFNLSADRLAGDALSVLSGAFYGGYILAVGRSRAAMSAPALMLWSGLAASILLLLAALALGEVVVPSTPEGWAVVLGLAVVSQVGGQGLIAWGLAHVPAAFGSIVLLLQPAVASLAAWMLFSEALGVAEIAGSAVILLGIHIARKAKSA